MQKRVFLGMTDYFGEIAKAYREVYPDKWIFVIETGEEKINLIEY